MLDLTGKARYPGRRAPGAGRRARGAGRWARAPGHTSTSKAPEVSPFFASLAASLSDLPERLTRSAAALRASLVLMAVAGEVVWVGIAEGLAASSVRSR